MKVLFDAIYTKFTETTGDPLANNAFYTDLSGKLYTVIVPQDVSMPYGTFSLVSDLYDWMFSLNGEFRDLIIQFDLFYDNESCLNIENTFNDLVSLYNWCTLSVSGYTQCYMRWDKPARLLRLEESNMKYWMKTADFRIFLRKN